MGFSNDELQEYAATFERDGMVVLKQHFPKATLNAWRDAFEPLLRERVASGTTAVRGDNRHYITLPFAGVFADESIFCDPGILGIVERVAGGDPVMCQLATDTPLIGSTYQDLHRDTPPLFDDLPETPSFQLAVNFPLCDVSLENGPFETTLGTHRMRPDEAMKAWNEKRIGLHAIQMELGDVIIRDVRALHRGTPNKTNQPRPMVVIGYSRSWYFRPEVHIDVPVDLDERLSPRAMRLLRHMPRVAALDAPRAPEAYQKFAY
ncbi:phytanoyl-CoA dioxygenase family protein [Paraburkholderia sp. FT54]|uniref:phytanoyl-CoA dioxygenase family protein n=1 Tax=Paraburkholderia sp. FT54 TaxID=3074437 RepID=UPI0028772A93|nr:phytanoyl-CoA dioxygenase family protein [Paraburkholderia sp. FT54]WNC94505.1 phytanoyl-CoA dioxygenase family protein [Paraburkholderia sp. FT54]